MGRRTSTKQPKTKRKNTKRKNAKRKNADDKHSLKRVDHDQLNALIDRAGQETLSEQEREELRAVVDTLAYLVSELDEKNLTLRRLRSLLGLPASEKLGKIFPDEVDGDGDSPDETPDGGDPKQKPSDKPKGTPKGHGRNGEQDYTSAERVDVPHESLKPGDPCPRCPRGKVYERKTRPRILVRVEGQPPLKATVYKLQTLRCSLCGHVFAARPPDGVGDEKYDAGARAMIALLKYGSGLPFNRLERLERRLGVPLPASTQWDLMAASARELTPVYEALVHAAAQGELIHNDDSTFPVLELLKENPRFKAEGKRTGMFVTGLLSVSDERRIGLFFTGRNHAGENLDALLALRSAELEPPLHMADGLDRNDPQGATTRRCCCMAHARRKFVEVAESFPSECGHVLRELAKVYKHDDEARELGLTPEQRLAHHQENSAPVLEALKKWCKEQTDERKVEPNSSLGRAISYMTKEERWEQLTRFLREAGAPLDNNACERQLKQAILLRKNSLFYKTLNGAKVGDLLMSLIYSTELAEENTFDYLRALIEHPEQIAHDPEAWLPWNFREALAVADAPSE